MGSATGSGGRAPAALRLPARAEPAGTAIEATAAPDHVGRAGRVDLAVRGLREAGRLERIIGALVAFLLGLHFIVHAGVGLGDALALLLLPVWIPVLKRYRGSRIFLAVGAAAAVWGWILASNAAHDGFAITSSVKVQTTTELIGIVAGVGALLWARGVLSASAIGAWFGAGMIVNGALYGQASGNAWKFIWAVPVSVLVISLAARRPGRFVGIIALLGLAVLSTVLDCRSYSAALVLSAILLLGTGRLTRSSKRPPWVFAAGLAAALAGGIYYLAQSLLVAGYLGAQEQARTIAQLQVSGSLILGGRPEISATWALMRFRPQGYGAGVVPRSEDILAAKTGMSGIGYDPNNGYVEKFMFGGHIELHSLVGDMWASFGLVGLLFTAMIAFLMIRSVSTYVAKRTGNCLVIFLCVWTLWNIGFSPLASSAPILILGAALVLPERMRALAAADPVPDES